MFDTYKTLEKPIEAILLKEKGSKFIGYAYPVSSEEDVKKIVQLLWKEHHQATHICYAFQIGTTQVQYRANDDGEPKNSAGMPIYGQIQAFELHNVLVAVVRYFGGTKLGVGGLMTAYKETAHETLSNGFFVEKMFTHQFLLSFSYDLLNKVMRLIKEKNIQIIKQEMTENIQLTISVRKDLSQSTFETFAALYPLTIVEIE